MMVYMLPVSQYNRDRTPPIFNVTHRLPLPFMKRKLWCLVVPDLTPGHLVLAEEDLEAEEMATHGKNR